MKASELEAAPRSRAAETTRMGEERLGTGRHTRSRGWVRLWMSSGLEGRKGEEGPEVRQTGPIEHKPSVAGTGRWGLGQGPNEGRKARAGGGERDGSMKCGMMNWD
jgi:hypothetical protein